MAARARAFALIVTVGALVASGTIAVASGAQAAPTAAPTPPWFAKGKATRAHLSTTLDRVAQPSVAAGSARAQAAAAGTPVSGPGSLLRAGSGQLRVDIRVASTSAATVSALSAAGAHVTFVSAANRTITAAVRPVDLVKVGGVAGVQYVSQILTPMTSATCPSGSIVSEGDSILNAATARSHFGVDGTGVTVGVLSDSFAQITTPTSQAGDVASGDLPGVGNTCGYTTPVNNIADTTPPDVVPEDEGRAMAQTVHDLAPGAHLAFATAFTGEDQFASNIQALATAGAKVIVDDVTYFEEPMYQDGVISNAISNVTADGVSYFTAAANNNVVYTDVNGVRHDAGSYEATGGYRSTTCPAALNGAGYLDCHNFRTSGTADNTYGLTVQPGGFINLDLQWAQPQLGVTADYDAFVLNSAGNVVAFAADDNTASQKPVEVLQYANDTASSQAVRVVLARFAGPKVRFKFVLLENGSTGLTAFEYRTNSGGDVFGPTIFGHNGADKAGSVAAVPYSDPTTPEYYSSRGPVTLLYAPVNGATPASSITPQTLAKPDFAATDCVQNTFFGSEDPPNTPPWRFCGTSDAAPHAAGVAALLLENDPTLTPAQLRTALATGAAPVAHGGTTSSGAGLLDANPDGDTTTALVPSTTAAQPGHPVTLTATVAASVAGTPTGTVSFVDGGTSLGSPVPLVSGQASLTTSTLPSGNHTIHALYNGDTDFNPSSATANVAVDGAPPAVSVTSPAHLFPVSKTITVTYSATDAISGVANYDIRYRVAPWNGVFSTTYVQPWTHVTGTTQSLTGTPGNEYCFSVRATDHAGNPSGWSSEHCAVVPLDDRDLGLATTGWSRGTSSPAYLGTVTRTSTAGAKLRKTGAQLNRIALIVSTCSTCGRIGIYFNGTLWHTVNTFASTTHYKVVLIQPLTYQKTRTIELKALDSGKKVVIDGLSIARS